MTLKEYLEKVVAEKRAAIQKKEQERTALEQRADACNDINEMKRINAEARALGETLVTLKKELEDAEEQLKNADEPANEPAPAAGDSGNGGDGQRAFNPMGGMTMRNGAANKPAETRDKYDTEEYRKAFMEFACRGVAIPAEYREAGPTATADAGAVIPTTIVKEIVKELKSYGSLYNGVRKLNIQGGVKIPILSLKPTASWIGETSPSADQKIKATESISFSYFGLECKVSQTLLASVTTLDMFQQLFAELAVEAIVHALDLAIMNGEGTSSPLGITKDTRVPADNIITLAAADFTSWAGWKKKVFAKMKKSYRNGVFYMAQATFDGYIDGMVDSNGQPIGRVNYGIDGEEKYRFGGKTIETVETDIIKDYDTATTNDVIAVFCKLSDYAINSNMQLTTVKWTDHDTNEIKNKVILICDGKLVDPNGVLIIKKGA